MKRIRLIIVVIVLAALAVGYFYYLSNRKNEESYNSEDTEVTKVFYAINRNLDENYPETAKEVVEFYVLIEECMYNEEYSDSEFVDLINQMRKLLDQELLDTDTFSEQYEALSVEVVEKQNTGTKLIETTLGSNRDVSYTVFEENDYAKVPCVYYFKNEDGTVASSQEYILRKDEDGNWKVLATNLIENDN